MMKISFGPLTGLIFQPHQAKPTFYWNIMFTYVKMYNPTLKNCTTTCFLKGSTLVNHLKCASLHFIVRYQSLFIMFLNILIQCSYLSI